MMQPNNPSEQVAGHREPWGAPQWAEHDISGIKDCNGVYMFNADHSSGPVAECEFRAEKIRRIVVCVNACSGMPDPIYEINRLQRVCHDQQNQMHEYRVRINELERNNSILADQLKKREGMWLAPVEPDPAMLKIAMSWFNGWTHMNNATRESNLEEAYKVMRDNWLGRQK